MEGTNDEQNRDFKQNGQLETKDNSEHNAVQTVKDQSNLSKTKCKNSSLSNNLKGNISRTSGLNLQKMLHNDKDTKLQSSESTEDGANKIRSKISPPISNGKLCLTGSLESFHVQVEKTGGRIMTY